MPSTGPSSNIPLDTLPFLGPRHATHNGDLFADQPSISRYPRTDDNNDDDDDDGEEGVGGDGDGDEEDRVSRPHRRAASPTLAIAPAWRLHLYNLLERPNSSPAAVLVHVLVTALIVFSALVTILETVPAFHSLPGGIWFGLETSLVALFTIEYVARCAATSYSWSSLFGWVGCTSFLLLQVWTWALILSLILVTNSVLWHHGPSCHPSFLHRDRSAKRYCQSSCPQPLDDHLTGFLWPVCLIPQSILFRFSILRTFRLLRVFRPFRYNNTLLLYVFQFDVPLAY